VFVFQVSVFRGGDRGRENEFTVQSLKFKVRRIRLLEFFTAVWRREQGNRVGVPSWSRNTRNIAGAEWVTKGRPVT